MRLDRASGRLWNDAGALFEPQRRLWVETAEPPSGAEIEAPEAVRWLQRESGRPCRIPIGVIGPREPKPGQAETAEQVGAAIAELGLTLLCGGRQGVMEAACRGAALAGGIAVGILPDETWDTANAYVTVPIATGIGVARNAIIARAALCLIAIGGGNGTISEIGFGLQFGRPVFGLAEAPAIPGLRRLASAEEAADAIVGVVLNLAPNTGGRSSPSSG